MEVAQPGVLRQGYDKTVPAWVDEYLKMKARKKNSASGEEQEYHPKYTVIVEQRGGSLFCATAGGEISFDFSLGGGKLVADGLVTDHC